MILSYTDDDTIWSHERQHSYLQYCMLNPLLIYRTEVLGSLTSALPPTTIQNFFVECSKRLYICFNR